MMNKKINNKDTFFFLLLSFSCCALNASISGNNGQPDAPYEHLQTQKITEKASDKKGGPCLQNPLEEMNEQHIRHMKEKAAIEQDQQRVLMDLENEIHTQKLKIREEEFEQRMKQQKHLHQYQMTVDKEKRKIHQKEQQAKSAFKKEQYAIQRAQQKQAAKKRLEEQKEADRVYFEQKEKEQKEKDLEFQRQKQKNEEDIEDLERQQKEEREKKYVDMYYKLNVDYCSKLAKIKEDSGLELLDEGVKPMPLYHTDEKGRTLLVGVNPGMAPTGKKKNGSETSTSIRDEILEVVVAGMVIMVVVVFLYLNGKKNEGVKPSVPQAAMDTAVCYTDQFIKKTTKLFKLNQLKLKL